MIAPEASAEWEEMGQQRHGMLQTRLAASFLLARRSIVTRATLSILGLSLLLGLLFGVAYGREAAKLAALQALFVGAGTALAVFFLVAQPIRRVADELRTARSRAGAHLPVPARNESNEIGQLVGDANLLISDLTDLLSTENELRAEKEVSERRMRLIFEKSATGIFMLNAAGVIHSCNPAFVRILGLPPGAQTTLPGTPLASLLASHRASVEQLVQRTLDTAAPSDTDLRLSPDDALHEVWVEISLNLITPGLLQGLVNDISERKHSEIDARHLAAHDVLTGLLNRHGMNVAIRAVFDRQARSTVPAVALMQIDLDYFKQVNDTHGHEAGDRVLCHVARVLELSVRRGDLIARPGGDEFLAVLVGIDSRTKAEEIARQMIERIRQPIDIGNGHYARVSASIGIAFAATPDDTLSTVMCRADGAMYAAKQAGRGRARMAPSTADIHAPTSRGIGI
jgi:diguanylate cyclase (GGDEF)-like protein/PAS domain S-box-containing protein